MSKNDKFKNKVKMGHGTSGYLLQNLSKKKTDPVYRYRNRRVPNPQPQGHGTFVGEKSPQIFDPSSLVLMNQFQEMFDFHFLNCPHQVAVTKVL